MRTATLYSAEKKTVNIQDRASIPYIMYDRIVPCYNSDDYLLKEQVKNLHNLPIERWVFDGVEFFTAYDPVLREIIDIKVQGRAYDMQGENRIKIQNLEHEIKLLQSRSIWDMIRDKYLTRKKK